MQTQLDLVNDAIARSISHNEIVTLTYSPAVFAALKKAAGPGNGVEVLNRRQSDIQLEIHGSSGVTHQFWGSDEGDEWRVHLVRRESLADIAADLNR